MMSKFLGKTCLLAIIMIYVAVIFLWTSSRQRASYERRPQHDSANMVQLIRVHPVRLTGNEFTKLSYNDNQTSHTGKKHIESYRHLKKILYWNDAYSDKGFLFGQGQEPFQRAGCRVSTCYATHDRTLFPLEEVDAVLWHLRAKDKTFPPRRSPHTYYVFWMIESALYTYDDLSKYNGVFNWTFTYKTDSDFQRPYGWVVHDPAPRVSSSLNYALGKTKLAALFSSNCATLSQREILVRTLQNAGVPIDVYGRCGPFKYKKDEAQCMQMLKDDYKFYLSFENSLCYEYVTEKLFKALRNNVVPVVYGLGYKNLNLPPHSYIDVMDFSSVQLLADYLLYLDGNDTAYSQYFRWKSEGYRVLPEGATDDRAFCELCERLHSTDRPDVGLERSEIQPHVKENANYNNMIYEKKNFRHKKGAVLTDKHHKIYRNLHQWFVKDECMTPFTNLTLAAFIRG